MLLAQIFIVKGPTEEQKCAVIEKITAALLEAIGAPKKNVCAWTQSVLRENWGIASVSARDLGR